MQSSTDLMKNVERLWQTDILPYVSEKHATRSKQDQQAMKLLESRTVRIEIDGVQRYATPLLRAHDGTHFAANKEPVFLNLKHTERRLLKGPDLARIHSEQIQKLVDAGYVKKLSDAEVDASNESWFVPHHVVRHNGKYRLVFNCSFQCKGMVLNEHLIPGPVMGPSLLGVLLCFRQHSVAISGDIKAMFHQVRLLPEDRPLLRFLWRDLKRDNLPDAYEWKVLPFGTTCSPCCATFALQTHVQNNKCGNEDVVNSVSTAFYVDNCLDSLTTPSQAKQLIDKMRRVLSSAGFEIRQWASNVSSVVEHLPPEARSEGCDLWLSYHEGDTQESTLGLCWNCRSDELTYKSRPIEYKSLTLRNIYKILASQYDPIGYLAPFTARAKVLVQDLWKTPRSWDAPIEPGDIRDKWLAWQCELPDLEQVRFPRYYLPPGTDPSTSTHTLHIFCDASERIYGSVAYLRTEDANGVVQVSFVLERSRIAPKRQLSMPRLELSAALTGAQLAHLLLEEFTLTVQQMTLWSDSMTVLNWLHSDSCCYKVFVGTRVAEIQTLTDGQNWRYVNTRDNPADDITRGLPLHHLCQDNRWRHGPSFLARAPDQWPQSPNIGQSDVTELRKSTFCGTVSADIQTLPDPSQFESWNDLVMAAHQCLNGVASNKDCPTLSAHRRGEIENLLLQHSQHDSFPDKV